MLDKIQIVKPAEIEKRSMEIITSELNGRTWPEPEFSIVKRCIHTSADFDYADNLCFSEGVVEKAKEAIRNGACIVTDTQMAKSGINKKKLAAYGGDVFCFMSDEDVAETAKKSIVNDTPAQPLIDMLLSDTLKVTFPTDATNESDEDAEDVFYMVALDEKGIRCIKNGSDTYEWKIEFEDDSQYEAVRDFLGWASPRMDNLLFAAHDNFWMDYLKGDLDVDAFKDFLVGTNNGIPNYGIGDEENMYIDETKLQWTKYMNPLGAHFGTPEELFPIPEL